MRVAISGSRAPDLTRGRTTGWTDALLVQRILLRLAERPEVERVNVGDAPSGVDYFVAEAFECDERLEHKSSDWLRVYEARWNEEGRAAGHNRNRWMIAESDELIALFAPGPLTPGTSSAVEYAKRRGIPIWAYHEGVWERIP